MLLCGWSGYAWSTKELKYWWIVLRDIHELISRCLSMVATLNVAASLEQDLGGGANRSSSSIRKVLWDKCRGAIAIIRIDEVMYLLWLIFIWGKVTQHSGSTNSAFQLFQDLLMLLMLRFWNTFHDFCLAPACPRIICWLKLGCFYTCMDPGQKWVGLPILQLQMRKLAKGPIK